MQDASSPSDSRGATFLGARELRERLRAHDFVPRKELGQNFVIDPNTIRKIVAIAEVKPDERVLEIGAGAGSLTIGLVAAGARVTAVEFDEVLIRLLTQTFADVGHVDVVQEDALRLDLADVDAAKLVANLPYNIAATIVIRVLESAPQINEMTVMTQREVGERLAAAPGSKVYGQTSALVAYFAHAKVAARISRRVFYPEPRVDSVVVKLVRRTTLAMEDPTSFVHIVKAAFAQRRKTLRQALAGLVGSAQRAEELLVAAGIEPTARAEQLEWRDFVAVAERASRLR